MATRKRKSTAQSSKPRTPGEEQAQEPLNGVLVRLAQQGEETALQVQVLGETKATEAPSLLRLAAKRVEADLGI